MSSPINACLGGYALCRGSKITGAHGLSSSSSKYLWRPGFLRIHTCIYSLLVLVDHSSVVYLYL